ncbi:MAG: DUF4197 domain-containing protein [Deltaproteobacteria bacterium]|jgi:hypothetical protein
MKTRFLCILGVVIALAVMPASPGHAQWGDMLKSFKNALGVGGLTQEEIIAGLKEALRVGTGNAVEKVSKVGGYYNNPNIRIPLPGPVQKVEKVLRLAGLGSQVDAFDKSMNRAAERAAPEAKSLFWNAIKTMTFSDARKILNGRENEATLYFKDKTWDRLEALAKPVVHDAMGEVGVTRTYQNLEARARTVPLAGNLSFDLDQYVTQKTLDGLFFMLAQEERKIREDPAARTTELLKKVFGTR